MAREFYGVSILDGSVVVCSEEGAEVSGGQGRTQEGSSGPVWLGRPSSGSSRGKGTSKFYRVPFAPGWAPREELELVVFFLPEKRKSSI